MRIKRPFAATFIEKLDGKLLLNKPSTWSVRAHLVIYYAGIFILLLSLLGFLLPNDPRDDTNTGVWSSLLAVVSTIALVVWLIYLLRFNVFKRFGIQKTGDGIKAFGLYFLVIGILVGIPFIPPAIESVRANTAYTNEEVIADYNMINESIVTLEHDSLNHRWSRQTVLLDSLWDGTVDTLNQAPSYTEERGTIQRYDSLTFYNTIVSADSTVKINDTAYIVYECPDYLHLNRGSLDEFSDNDQVSSIDIYRNIVQNYKQPDREKLMAEVQKVVAKYKKARPYDHYYGYDEVSADTGSVRYQDYMGRLRERYSIASVATSMENIIEQKDRWKGDNWQIPFRIFYYTTLMITLLLFMFRHSTVRSFFLGLLVITVLSIITTVVMAMSRNPQTAIFPVMLMYWIAFGVAGLIGRAGPVRHAIGGIGINNFLLGFPFVPLLIVGWYYVALHSRPYSTYDAELFKNETLHLVVAEIAGSLLLLILIEPVFKKLYRKWYSLPEA